VVQPLTPVRCQVVLLAAALLFWSGCSPQPTPPPRPATDHSEARPLNRLLFAGDVMLCRDVGRRMRETKDPAHPFVKIAPLLASADLTFINLESPFADKGPRGEEGLIFRARPEMVEGLVLAGVDVASTANNHARDCGDYGVGFTIAWLRAHHIEPTGTGETAEKAHDGVVLERHGVRFGFLGFTYDQSNGNWHDVDPRVALLDQAAMQRDVAALLKKADVVIVSMHNGNEYQKQPNPKQIEFAHAAIDAGATLVIGHHPHVTQPSERYGRGVIFYSLGNLIFDQYQRVETQHGEIAEVIFAGKDITRTNVIPVRITRDGPEVESPGQRISPDKSKKPAALPRAEQPAV
jgi:poly-gamma-glutamate capsule biosynthesis protein CapA/YwtB (metallophosphatase superfamily)